MISIAALLWQSGRSSDLVHYGVYFLLGLLASTLKVRLPRIQGTLSGGFVFVLLGIAEFSFSQTILMAWSTGLVQCFWRVQQRQVPRQLLFNLATLGNSATLAYWAPRIILDAIHLNYLPILLILATTLYFWTNNISVLVALALVEDKPLANIWRQCSIWSYWYYLVQSALVIALSVCLRAQGWVFSSFVIVLLMLVQFSFRRIARWFLNGRSLLRKAQRYKGIRATAELIWTDRYGNQHMITGSILDISERGLKIESPEPLSTSKIHISAQEHEIDASGEVCYCEFRGGKYVAGIEFYFVLTQRQLMSLLYTRDCSSLLDRA